MKRVLLVLLYGLVLGTVACDGSGGVTLAEYLAEMDSLRARIQDEGRAQRTEFEAIHEEGDPFTEEKRAKHDRERWLNLVRWVKELSLELDEVEPAKQAKKAHQAYIKGLDGFAAVAEGMLTDDAYQELFYPLRSSRRGAAQRQGLTLAQFEDSALTLSHPRLSGVTDSWREACGELLEMAELYWEEHFERDEVGAYKKPCQPP